jgi:hypothetical protein
MPKRITNPLRAGLPSKIYYLAYNGPITGYEIAKKIYGIKPPAIPPTAKTYEWIKKLKDKGILLETEHGCFSNVEPLLDEIEVTLKKKDNSDFSTFDKYITRRILDCNEFRASIKKFNLEKTFNQNQDFDSAGAILEFLSFQAMRVLTADLFKYEARNEKEFDRFFDIAVTLIHDPEVQKELQEVDLLKAIKDPKRLSETKKRISEMKNRPLFDIDSLGIFLAVPNTTLEKLCKLNKYYETIANLTSSPLYFETFKEFAQKLYTQKRSL